MSRSGFTFIETLTVLVIVTTILSLGTPTFRRWLGRESVRAARHELSTHLARTRAAAVQRGCRAVLHLDDTYSRVWVTSCRVQGLGIDTVGSVDDLAERFGVALDVDGDSIVFTPQGIAYGTSWLTVNISNGSFSKGIEISPLGNALW